MMHKKMINEAMRIAGEKVTSDKTINVEYPFTGEVIGTVPAGTAEHAQKAFDIAANYKPNLSRYERQKILQKTCSFAKIGFVTTENEPSIISQNLANLQNVAKFCESALASQRLPHCESTCATQRPSRVRRRMNNELNFPPNFKRLVPGCIDADFCK